MIGFKSITQVPLAACFMMHTCSAPLAWSPMPRIGGMDHATVSDYRPYQRMYLLLDA